MTTSISKLPAPPQAPPELGSNTVKLYKHASWSSTSSTLHLGDYTKDTRQSISGTALQDNATWVAFNLPVGTVVTMTQHVASVDGSVYNLKGCGRVVDLVGTGQTEAVDLRACSMNDVISSWFWHTPNFGTGAIELYSDANFKGNRTVIFLSEWPAGQLHSLSGWYIADGASSAQWGSLVDAQTAALFQHADGSGSSYQNIKAWGSFKSLANFKTVGFNDKLSSLSWNNLVPMQEVIAPLDISVSNTGGGDLTEQLHGTNATSEVQLHTITLENTTAQSTTVTVTNQYTAGIQLTYGVSSKFAVGIATQTVSWEIQLSFQYTTTKTSTTTLTETQSLSISHQFAVPPNSVFDADLLVQLGRLTEATTYTTEAQRWYDEQLDGSTLDPANGWYVRTEPVTFQMGGALAASTLFNVSSEPL